MLSSMPIVMLIIPKQLLLLGFLPFLTYTDLLFETGPADMFLDS